MTATKKNEKKGDYSGAVTAGVYIVGGVLLYGAISSLIPKGYPAGSTRKVKFDKDATQYLLMPIGGGKYEKIPDEFHPADLTDRLYTAMVDWDWMSPGETDRSKVWNELAAQGKERLKWIHNYWLDHHDSEDTLYRWIDQEVVLEYTDEAEAWRLAKDRLENAGVGF